LPCANRVNGYALPLVVFSIGFCLVPSLLPLDYPPISTYAKKNISAFARKNIIIDLSMTISLAYDVVHFQFKLAMAGCWQCRVTGCKVNMRGVVGTLLIYL
jgi:hypothetical protein